MNRVVSQKNFFHALRVLISAVALVFVFQRVDFEELGGVLFRADPCWLVLAYGLYHISQLFSAIRLNEFFSRAGARLDFWFNVRLNYAGMFYNMFLPGGLGGDAYKVILLKAIYRVPVLRGTSCVFLNRLNGLGAMLFLAGWFLSFSSFVDHLPFSRPVVILTGMLPIPAMGLLIRWFYPRFESVFLKTTGLSLLLQGVQTLMAMAIAPALGLPFDPANYVTLFLVSSFVQAMPISIGGVGLRELVFLTGFQFLEQDEHTAVAFGLLLFIINGFTAIWGVLFTSDLPKDPGVTPV